MLEVREYRFCGSTLFSSTLEYISAVKTWGRRSLNVYFSFPTECILTTEP
uniref:Adaptor protein complex AP-1, gamma 1 subunit n=2 Tax=Mus TaxID=862507 RepID=Q3TDN1_MOUSE|nr:unnamed protein product [Mus musculus]